MSLGEGLLAYIEKGYEDLSDTMKNVSAWAGSLVHREWGRAGVLAFLELQSLF